jgi:hypothetical protein
MIGKVKFDIISRLMIIILLNHLVVASSWEERKLIIINCTASLSKGNFVHSFQLVKKLYKDCEKFGPNFNKEVEEIISQALGKFHESIRDFFTKEPEECLKLVLDSNDIAFYFFFGTLMMVSKTYFTNASELSSFFQPNDQNIGQKIKKISQLLYYRYYGLFKLITRNSSLEEWKKYRNLALFCVKMIKFFPYKCVPFYPRIADCTNGIELIQRLSFVAENFEIQKHSNNGFYPSMEGFIKVYFELELLSSRITLRGSNRSFIYKRKLDLISLFKLYCYHWFDNFPDILEEHLYSLPPKLLALMASSTLLGKAQLLTQFSKSVDKIVFYTINSLRVSNIQTICSNCAYKMYQIGGVIKVGPTRRHLICKDPRKKIILAKIFSFLRSVNKRR